MKDGRLQMLYDSSTQRTGVRAATDAARWMASTNSAPGMLPTGRVFSAPTRDRRLGTLVLSACGPEPCKES